MCLCVVSNYGKVGDNGISAVRECKRCSNYSTSEKPWNAVPVGAQVSLDLGGPRSDREPSVLGASLTRGAAFGDDFSS